MSNPVFNNSEVFGDPRAKRGATATQGRPAYGTPPAQGRPAQPGPYGQAPAYGSPQAGYGTPQPGYGAPQSGQGAAQTDATRLQGMYDAPSATTADTKRLTYDDVIMKTGGLLALLVVVAAGSWYLTPQMPRLWIGGAIVGLVLGLVNAFKREPSPVLIMLYTLAQGVFLGGISKFYETAVEGVVPAAVIATIATFGVSLLLFRSGKVRVTGKFMRWLMIAMVGYLVFSLVNVVLLATGVLSGWGLYEGFGLIASLLAVGLAAASLIVDFDSIKRGVEAGAPAKFAWSAAFGLMVTLIWLYLEFLRLFAILQSD